MTEHRIRGLGARDGKEVDSWGPAERGRIPYNGGPGTGAEWHREAASSQTPGGGLGHRRGSEHPALLLAETLTSPGAPSRGQRGRSSGSSRDVGCRRKGCGRAGSPGQSQRSPVSCDFSHLCPQTPDGQIHLH